ncbi:TonB-dependent receptor domain-containing protein [Sediminibacterium sp.]|uniref:TonB-dependent receptor family protein n=1 Tax=Sediminibacterium sp. TaxID=1917865 RepID=UPI0027370BB4|nr:TonB-dependent receptor [Sediminibacterium sp.]MDP3392973.1 TonB-dependent receptor [Sediminibacterium sp.]MDP3567179.1 TonB-dependent receptor [Sediminibacterium sp.]
MKRLVVLTFILISFTLKAQQAKDSITTVELESVTIVGSRAHLIPGAGQYISSKQLAKLNQTNINNVLRIIPGVNIRDEEGFGLRPNIGLRGTPVNRSAKITLMEDGVLIAPAPYADPSAYYFPSFARMQGVEVLKGSSQIKYGPYTVGGAVNLLSTSIPNSFKGFAHLSVGSFGTNQQRIWVGDSQQNFDYVFEVNRLASNGFKELDNGDNTGFDRRDVLAKLRWHNGASSRVPQSVTLKIVNTSEKANETYLGLTYEDYQANALRRYSATQKDLLNLSHNHISLTHSIKPTNQFSIVTTAYYSTTFRDWGRVNTIGGQSVNNILSNPTLHQLPYQIMTGKANGNIDFQNAARTYFSKGIQSNAQFNFTTGNLIHKLQLGVRIHADQADRYATRSVYAMTNGTMVQTSAGVNGNQENQIRNANSVATYLSYDLTYKGLTISPGIRYENIQFDFQNFGNADNGRLGANLRSATNQMKIVLPGIGFNYALNNGNDLFAGIHKGFSPPGMPSVNSTTGQAKVETAINYELGYRYNNKAVQLQAAAFLNDYANILGSDNMSGGGLGTGDQFNAGNATIKGIELSVGYDLLYKENVTTKMPINLAYTYTNATFRETFQNGGGDWGSGIINRGDFIPFITPHLFTASIGIETQKMNTTLVARYVGKTRTTPGQTNTIVPERNVLYNNVNAIAGFVIIDLSSNYQINKTLSAFATINNITNNKSIVANLPNGYRPNMPLGFNMGIKAIF